MNLLKELQKTSKQNAQKEIAEQEKFLNSVKSHLNEEENKDILKFFGTHKVLSEATEKKQKTQEILEKGFLLEKDIKTICNRYRLRCLRIDYYKKEVPAQALQALKEKNLSSWDMSTCVYIIAPSNHFKLGERPKNDPILLYKKDDMYEIISSWGSDFSFLRRVYSAFMSWAPVYAFVSGLGLLISAFWGVIDSSALYLTPFFIIVIVLTATGRWDFEYDSNVK